MAYEAQITELKERRRRLVEVDARGIHEKAANEKREVTAEEDANWKRALDDAEKIQGQVERLEAQDKAERSLGVAERRTTPDAPDADKGTEQRTDFSGLSPEYRAVFERVYGAGGTAEARELATPGYQKAFRNYLLTGAQESRAHQADSDISGGYLKSPPQFVAGILQAVDNQLFLRNLATKHQTSTSLGVVTLDTDLGDADWTAELTAVTESSDLAFGKRELNPSPLSKMVKVSRKLLRAAAVSPEAIILERLAYRFAVAQESAFMTGDGQNKPLGLFTASALGVSTSRDVSTGNSTSAPKFDGLKEAKYTLKSQYWAKAAWLFHRDAIKSLGKEKDGEGRYIWEPSVKVGEPDRLIQFPFYVSEYVPSTFTTGKYVGMLGDFSYYWIADSLNFEVQRLVELYAATNQIGFIGRAEVDAMPVLAEAFIRVKLA